MVKSNRKALTRRRRVALSAAVFAAAPLLANQFANAVGTESYTGLAGGDIGLNTNYSSQTAPTSTWVLVYNKASLTSLTNTSAVTALALNFDTNVGALTIGQNTGSGSITLANAGSINILSTIVGSSFADTIASALTLTPASATTAGVASFTNGSTTSSIVLDITGPIGVGTTTNNEVLDLAGANTGINTVSGVITGPSGGTLTISKSGVGQWTDSATNTFSGSVLVSGGTLNLTGKDTITGFSTVSAGTLNLVGTTSFSAASTLSGTGFDYATGTTTLGNLTDSTGTFYSTGTTTFGVLTLNGAGTISAAGVSTLTSATVSAGTFSSTGTTSFGTLALSGTGSISAAGVSTFGAAASIGTISGGLLNATGNSTFAGTLNFSNGTLASTGTTSFGTLALSGGTLSSTGTTTFGAITQTGGTLSLGAAGISTFSGNLAESAGTFLAAGTINGAGGITVSGTGYAALSGTNGFKGAITYNAGTLLLTGFDTSAGTVSIAGNTSVYPNLVLNLTNGPIINSSSGLVLGDGTLTLAGTSVAGQGVATLILNASTQSYLELGSTTLSVAAGSITRNAGNTFVVDESNGGTLKLGTTTAALLPYMLVQDASGTGFGTVSTTGIVSRFTASTNLPATIGSASGNYTTSGTFGTSGTVATNSLTTNASSAAGTLDLGGGSITIAGLALLNTGTNNFNIQNGTLGTNNSEVIFHQVGSGLETVSAIVSGGSGYITKDGTGALLVSGANKYTGTTLANGGTLIVGTSTSLTNHTGALGIGTNSLNIAPGATVDVNGNYLSIDQLLGSGTITNNNASAMGTISIGNNSTTDADTQAISVTLKDGLSPLTVVDSTTAVGGANTILSSNPYTGPTYLNSTGELRLKNAVTPLGTGTIYFSNAFLEPNVGGSLPNNLVISGSANNILSDVGCNFTGSLSGAGSVEIQPGGSTTFSGDLSAFTGTIDIENTTNRGLANEGIDVAPTNAVTTLGVPSGRVVLDSQPLVGSGAQVFEYGGAATTATVNIGELDGGTAGIVTTITPASAVTFKVGGLSTADTYNGTILNTDSGSTGTVSLEKTGTGVLTLTSANSYTGPTTIDAGVLLENGTFAAATNVGVGTISNGQTTGTYTNTNLYHAGELITGTGFAAGTIVTYVGSGTLETNIQSSGGSGNAASISIGGGSSLPANSNVVLNGGVLGLGAGDMTRALGTAGNTSAGSIQFTSNGGGFAAYGADRNVNFGGLGAAGTVTFGSGVFVQNGSPLILGAATATNAIDFDNPLNFNNLAQTIQANRGSSPVADGILFGILSNGGLTETGNGILQLAVSNSYAGGTTVNGGTLTDTATGVAGAFGSGSISVAPVGTLSTQSAALVANNDNSINSAAAVNVNNNSSALGTLYFNSAAPIIGSLAGNGNVVLATGTTLTTGNGSSTTFSGAISDGGASNVGSLTVTGSGTFTLGGANTFNGGMTINPTATVQIGAGVGGGAAGTVGNGAVNNNGTLIFNRTGEYDVPVTINGNGTVYSQGAGTINLAAAAGNAYIGGTSINAGTLLVNNTSGSATGTGAVNIGSGAALGGAGSVSGAVTVASGATLTAGNTNSSSMGTLTLGALTLNTGTQTLNFRLGNNTIANDVLAVTSANGLTINNDPASTYVDVYPTGTVAQGTYELVTFNGSVQGLSGTLAAYLAGVNLNEGRIAGTLVVDTSGQGIDLSVTGPSDTIKWTGVDNLNPSSIDPNWNIGTNINMAQAGTANFNWQQVTRLNGTDYLQVPADTITFDDSATGTTTINVTTVVSPANMTFNNSSLPYVFNGTGTIAGATGMSLNGTNSVTFNQTNTFTGLTTINAGTLIVGATGALASQGYAVGTASLVVNGALTGTPTISLADGTLAFTSNATLGTLTVNGGTASFNGTTSATATAMSNNSTATFSGNASLGTTTLSGGVATFGGAAIATSTGLSNGAVATFNGTASLGTTTISGSSATFNGAGTFTSLALTSAGAATFGIGDNASLGTFTESGGTATFGGTATATSTGLSNGAVATFVGNASLGTTTISNGAATFGSTATAASMALSNGAVATFVGNASLGTMTVNASTATFNSIGTFSSVALSNAGAATFGGNVVTAGLTADATSTLYNAGTLTATLAAPSTFNGTISGPGNLILQGNSTLLLGGANTFTGTTTLGGTATISIGNSLALQNSTLALSGGTLNLNGMSATLGGLSGASTYNIAIPGSQTLTIGNNNTSNAYAGTFSGSGNLLTTGTGTTTLSGGFNSSGSITVASGTTVFATGSGRTFTAPITINSGAELFLNGGNIGNTLNPAANPLVVNGTLDLNGAGIGYGTRVGPFGGPLSGSGTLTSSSTTLAAFDNTDDLGATFSGQITGNLRFAVRGNSPTAVLTLSGSNSYVGETEVRGNAAICTGESGNYGATLAVSNDNNLGATSVGTLESTLFGFTVGSPNVVILGDNVYVAGQGYQGTLEITGNTYNASGRNVLLDLAGGGINVASASNSFVLNGAVELEYLPHNYGSAAAAYWPSPGTGVISDGPFVKSGAGTLVLASTSNNYTGATSVVAGVLDITGAVSGATNTGTVSGSAVNYQGSGSYTVDATNAPSTLILDGANAIPSYSSVAGLAGATFAPTVSVNSSQVFTSLTNGGTSNFNAGSTTIGTVANTGTTNILTGATLNATSAFSETLVNNAGTVNINDNAGTDSISILTGTGTLGVGSLTTLAVNTGFTQGQVVNAGTVNINDSNATDSISTLSGTGTLNVGATATVTVGAFSQGTLVNNGVTQINGTGSIGQLTGTGTLNIGENSSTNTVQLTAQSTPNSFTHSQSAVTIAPGSTLDITNNTININYGSGASPLTAVANAVAYGAGAGTATNANGSIISSTVNAGTPGKYAVGYADAAEDANVPTGNVAIMYTLAGDNTLGGSVTFQDYSILQNSYGKPGLKDWYQGDYNHDGTVNFQDYSMLQNNYGKPGVSVASPLIQSALTTRSAKSAAAAFSLVAAGASPAIAHTVSPAVSSTPIITYLLSVNDDGSGNYEAGHFAVFATDTAPANNTNYGIAGYGFTLANATTVTNYGPQAQYFDQSKGKVQNIGFTANSSSSNVAYVTGSQDTVNYANGSDVVLVYGIGQTAGNLANDASVPNFALTSTQAVYGAPVELAQGTFAGLAPTFTSTGTATGNYFDNNSGANSYYTDAATLAFTSQTLSGSPAPEPATLGILGLVGVTMIRRRRPSLATAAST